MDFGLAITYPFDDDEWLKKLGLSVLIQFIPVIGALVLQGWSLEISRRVRRNDPTPLPDWQPFSDFLREGFLLFIAHLIYQLPTVLVSCVASFLWIIPFLGGGSRVPSRVGLVEMPILGCCLCLLFFYALAAMVIFWGGYVRYVDNPQFSTFFELGENLALVRKNLGDFGMIVLVSLAAGLVISAISSITFGLVGLVSTPAIMYFMGHVFGQLAQKLNPPMGGEPVMPAM